MAHVRIENLTFSYSGTECKALDAIDLDIPVGSFVLICGKTGSGKSTLLRHFKSTLFPEGSRTGTLYFDDVPIEQVSLYDQASKIGYVSQNPDAQLVTDKVWHEIAFGLESIGCDNATLRSRVAEMASFYHLQNWFYTSSEDLSEGQKQLVALASSNILQPELLVLDNPLSQLDPLMTADFINTLRKLNLELGITIVICEQRLEEIYKFTDRVVVMEDGSIAFDGTPREVARMLYESNSQMKYALPATLRLYHGLRPDADVAQGPLTIGDFRKWLHEVIGSKKISVIHLPDRNSNMKRRPPALEFENIRFRYKKDMPDLLRNFSLSIPQGSIHAIVGENGCGKSTILKIACGAIKNYQGTVKLYDHKINKMSDSELYQVGIGMLPQNLKNVFSHDTVRAELAEMLAFKHLSDVDLDAKIKSVAHTAGILDFLDKDPQTLSYGERQLVGIAKMLMRDLKVLLFDNPLKGLDTFSKRQIARTLYELSDSGVTMVVASNDLEFVAKYTTSVSLLFEGSIITTSSPKAFFSANTYYSTAASRMSRGYFINATTDEDVFILCQENGI